MSFIPATRNARFGVNLALAWKGNRVAVVETLNGKSVGIGFAMVKTKRTKITKSSVCDMFDRKFLIGGSSNNHLFDLFTDLQERKQILLQFSRKFVFQISSQIQQSSNTKVQFAIRLFQPTILDKLLNRSLTRFKLQ
jgi:hypothetical protein